MKPLRTLQRASAVAAAAGALAAAPALATWSIVVVNTRTHEVAVASATCLQNVNLRRELPVCRPGLGVGASQSQLDTGAINRSIMYDGLGNGLSPQEILAQLLQINGFQNRQFGIANIDDDPVTFTGAFCGLDAAGVAGTVGDLRYAIQGNVIVDDTLVTVAETALLSTPGDLATKLMAAMEAARAWGGDGRCSCSQAAPNSCAVPIPPPFKSAHVGFMIVARVGDPGGLLCGPNSGCATGEFYLAHNVIGGAGDPDPVVTLQTRFANWRANLAGRPDHILSRVRAGAQSLVADGVSATDVTVELVDLEGVPLSAGGATLTLTNVSGAPAVTTPSAVTDHGDGTYSFTLTAGAAAGLDRWRIAANDGVVIATLYPPLSMRVDPLVPLHCGYDQVSLTSRDAIPLTVNAGSPSSGRVYVLLAGGAGTQPGTPFGGATIPLNSDRLFLFTYQNPNSPLMPGSYGVLDASGRATASLAPRPALLALYAGGRIDFAGVVFDPFGASQPLGPVGFDIVP
jgi:hypothetical protein